MNMMWGYYIIFGIVVITVLLIIWKIIVRRRSRLIIVVGLPGSGKSQNALNELESLNWRCYDDFFRKAKNNTGTVPNAKYLPELKNNLESGTDCVVSDIKFCDSTILLKAIKDLESIYKFAWLRVVFFEKDLNKCIYNVNVRNSKSRNQQLDLINALGPNYDPKIAGYEYDVIPVWDKNLIGNYSYRDQLRSFINR